MRSRSKTPRMSVSPFKRVLANFYTTNAYELLIADFYDHVRDGRKFWIDGAEGIKTLRIISELFRSSQTLGTK
ncbi:hypothetical protein [Paenibacillus macerans]|uniref:hypothetical protein n=1 Tax=Paenibacillus macerans TaxID=44252 RepID=UPI002040C7B2|nr:hypothetical protein [Paenibacillus macerans]MCM3700156.1 hypothetical protein [Paenibacillus macerans]